MERLRNNDKNLPVKYIRKHRGQRTNNRRVLFSGKEQVTYSYSKYTLEERVMHFRKLNVSKCILFSGVPMMVVSTVLSSLELNINMLQIT